MRTRGAIQLRPNGHRAGRAALLLLGLALVLSACEVAGGGPPAAGADHYLGTLQASCSPVDAAAIDFELRPESGAELPRVSLVLWSFSGLAEGSPIRFGPEDNAGYGAMFVRGTEWTPAIDGELSLDSYAEGQSAAGWFWLELGDGDRYEGWFQAEWQDQGPVLCG